MAHASFICTLDDDYRLVRFDKDWPSDEVPTGDGQADCLPC